MPRVSNRRRRGGVHLAERADHAPDLLAGLLRASRRGASRPLGRLGPGCRDRYAARRRLGGSCVSALTLGVSLRRRPGRSGADGGLASAEGLGASASAAIGAGARRPSLPELRPWCGAAVDPMGSHGPHRTCNAAQLGSSAEGPGHLRLEPRDGDRRRLGGEPLPAPRCGRRRRAAPWHLPGWRHRYARHGRPAHRDGSGPAPASAHQRGGVPGRVRAGVDGRDVGWFSHRPRHWHGGRGPLLWAG